MPQKCGPIKFQYNVYKDGNKVIENHKGYSINFFALYEMFITYPDEEYVIEILYDDKKFQLKRL